MADAKITDLTTLSSVATDDYIPVVDVSDTTDSAEGTTKKITLANLVVTGAFLTATGTVNGSNTSFTFLTAPSVIVVDNIPKQKTSSDGTANWTGTTSVTLLVAPNFDIFGY